MKNFICILCSLMFILSCSTNSSKSDRVPSNEVIIDKTNKYPGAFAKPIVDTKYKFNNLTELDFYLGTGEKHEPGPRFKAIKFLTDYKENGYQVCPDNTLKNKFRESNSNFKQYKYLENDLLKEDEATFFVMSTVINDWKIWGAKKTKLAAIQVFLPHINIPEVNKLVGRALDLAQLDCPACKDEANISLGYLQFADEKNSPIYVLSHQTDESLSFVSELGKVVILPSFKKCPL